MPETANVIQEVAQYKARLAQLYESIKTWTKNREPGARFSEAPVQLTERRTGSYEAKILELARPNKPTIYFRPRGAFMVGAHGRVDVESSLGREILVWVEKGGPVLRMQISEEPGDVVEQMMRPLYADVEEGWAWGDEAHNRLPHLTEDIFWNNVIIGLSE